MHICKKTFLGKRTYYVSLISSLLLLFNLFIVSALADTGGHFILPELSSTITIDDEDVPATCSDVDWPNVGEFLDISITAGDTDNTSTGKLLIYHPQDSLVDEELYVFFKIDDTSRDTDGIGGIDNVVLMFDLSHDHAVVGASSFIKSDDRGIRFNRNGSVQRVYGDITNLTEDSDLTVFPDNRACISELDSKYWLIEARILPSDIGLNSFNDLLGIVVRAKDKKTNSYSRWPNTVTADPNSWANIVTRSPIDFVLLLDQSGSMSGDKWTSAKQAVNNFRALLSLLHDSELATEYSTLSVSGGGDRLGLATFSTSLSGNAYTNKPLDSIDSTVSDFTGVLLSPGGGTPMVAGVNETFDMFGGATHLGDLALTNPNIVRQKVVMLLSDGKHNTPSTTMDFDTEDTNDTTGAKFRYLPTSGCDSNIATNSLVRINTVAVGTDSTVDTSKLDDIKDCFSGSHMTNIYTAVGSTGPTLTAELSRFYFQTVYPYYHLNMINDTGANFSISDGERKLILFAFWPDTSLVTSLSITSPSSSVEAGTCKTSLGFCYLVVDNPEQGWWTNFSAPNAVPSGKYVLLDLRVEAKFAIDNQPHGTSSDITLKARLREDGKPITGATVNVQIARPEEGFGTFASTHSLDGCEVVQPSLPPIDPQVRVGLKADISNKDLVKLMPASNAENIPQATIGGDVNPPSFALMQQLLKTCGKADLDRTTDTGLTLYDDKSHGDADANDGIYTLVFNNTSIEGSHLFRFSASGTSLGGQPFHRMKDFGEYIRVDVDPAATSIDVRDVAQVGNIVYREYYIVPRDGGGQYLGPGHANQVKFQASSGTWAGPLRDYNNGIYARVLQYDVAQGVPEVIAVVQGKPIKLALRPFEFVPYIGATFFDSSLGLDDGVVLGARLNYRLTNQIVVGGELGVTLTEDSTGNSGNVIQALVNARYDLNAMRTGRLLPYLTAGAGYVFFRGFGIDDEAPAIHGGAGANFDLGGSFGIQLDARVLQIGSVMNAGSTTNLQVTGGLLFRF